VLLPFTFAQLRAAWPQVWPSRLRIFAMGTFGFTGFNALFYAAAYHTTAVNLSIIQGTIPVLVLVGTVAFLGSRARPVQLAGVVLAMAGVAVVAVKGDLHLLRTLGVNVGDLFMLIACVFYAGYTLALRNRPAVPGFVFFTALAGVAFVSSLPLIAFEAAAGTLQWPTPTGWLILIYVALFPSLLAQVFFMRGVELIGPGRAGIFVNLVPVFGSVFAVLLISEPFAAYHAVALALVLGGIWLGERR
jgi:drug/metabolite transporter (DMT)-like permease